MSYTVIMKADSGLDVEWPLTCLYCGEEPSQRINLPVGQVDRSMRKAVGRSGHFALPYCKEPVVMSECGVNRRVVGLTCGWSRLAYRDRLRGRLSLIPGL